MGARQQGQRLLVDWGWSVWLLLGWFGLWFLVAWVRVLLYYYFSVYLFLFVLRVYRFPLCRDYLDLKRCIYFQHILLR